MIEFFKNAIRRETARTLKSGQQIANKSIAQHQPVDCVKLGRYVWCKENTTKECKFNYMPSLFALSCNRLGMQLPLLIADADKLFVSLFQVLLLCA